VSSTSASGKRRSPAAKTGKNGRRGRGRPQGVKGWALWILKWGVISAAALFLLLVVVLFIAYSRTKIPNPNKAFQTQTTFVYYSDGKSEAARFADQNRVSIPYSAMPTCMKQAVVAAENKTFWTDKGIDPKGILRALFNNAQGNSTQGASTITQQYVKILYLN
jgi:membrane peptidoglycan carboxypeptidase